MADLEVPSFQDTSILFGEECATSLAWNHGRTRCRPSVDPSLLDGHTHPWCALPAKSHLWTRKSVEFIRKKGKQWENHGDIVSWAMWDATFGLNFD